MNPSLVHGVTGTRSDRQRKGHSARKRRQTARGRTYKRARMHPHADTTLPKPSTPCSRGRSESRGIPAFPDAQILILPIRTAVRGARRSKPSTDDAEDAERGPRHRPTDPCTVRRLPCAKPKGIEETSPVRLKGRQGRAVKEIPTSKGGLEDKLGRGSGDSSGGGSGDFGCLTQENLWYRLRQRTQCGTMWSFKGLAAPASHPPIPNQCTDGASRRWGLTAGKCIRHSQSVPSDLLV